MEPTSPYIARCPNDGERADVLRHPEWGYEVSCPACHRAEFGSDPVRTVRAFKAERENNNKEERK